MLSLSSCDSTYTTQLYSQLAVPGKEPTRFFLLLRQTPALVLPSSNGLWALSHPRRFPWTDLSHHWKLGLCLAHLVSLHWVCAPPVACSSHPPAVWQLLFPLTQEAADFLHCWESLDVKSWVWLGGLFWFWQCICAYPSLVSPGMPSLLPTFLLILLHLVVLCHAETHQRAVLR